LLYEISGFPKCVRIGSPSLQNRVYEAGVGVKGNFE